jgi:hypothetical protein
LESRPTLPRCLLFTLYPATIGLLGLVPHLAFSLRVGEISYFKYAYDEEYYSTTALQDLSLPGHLLSGVAFKVLHVLTGSDLQRTLILSDFVFPLLCAVAALYASLALFSRLSAVLIQATALLFAQELFSLGSFLWADASFNIASLRQALGGWGPLVVPDLYTSYFSVFRTPEPQVSWVVLFVFLGFTYRHFVTSTARLASRQSCEFVIICILASLAYVFCFALALACVLYLLVASALSEKRAHISTLSYAAGSSILAFVVSQTVSASPVEAAGRAVFGSRLPSLGASVFLGLLGLCACLFLWRRKRLAGPQGRFVVLCITLPLLLMDQQVLSGVMVSTREWERYTNYQLLVFGGGALVSLSRIRGTSARWMTPLALAARWLTLGVIAYVAVDGQSRSYRLWLAINDLSLAQRRAVEQAVAEYGGAIRKVVLADAAGGALLATRLGRGPEILLNYNRLFREPIGVITSDVAQPSGRKAHASRLFEYLARTGRDPAWLRRTLQAEMDARGGFYLGFFFSFRDYWGPFSDYRCVRSDKIRSEIPELVESYREYLEEPENEWNAPAVYLTTAELEAPGANGYWQHKLIGKTEARSNGERAVWAYLQTHARMVPSGATAGPEDARTR